MTPIVLFDSHGTRAWTNRVPGEVQTRLRAMQVGPTGQIHAVGDSGPPIRLDQVNPAGAPRFVSLPTNQEAVVGTTVEFAAEATGATPVQYYWYHDGQPIPSANHARLSISVTEAGLGDYMVSVSNDSGTIYSPVATLALARPNYAAPPIDLSSIAGDSIVLRAPVTGAGPMGFAWLRNGKRFSRTLTNEVTDTTSEDAEYAVVVTNMFGGTTGLVGRVAVSPSAPLQRWHRRGDTPAANLTSVIYAKNRFVAVGFVTTRQAFEGVIITSTNGSNWVETFRGSPYSLNGVAYGNGTFVATSGLPYSTSSDPPSWSGSLISTDAVHWVEGAPTSNPLLSIEFAAGGFLASSLANVFNSQLGEAYYSKDGRFVDAVGTRPLVYPATIGASGDRFVLAGSADGNFDGKLLNFGDGLAWDLSTIAGGTFGRIEGLKYGGGKFLLLSSRPSGIVDVFSSDNGRSFSATATITNHHVALGYGNGTWVAVGDGILSASLDGKVWSRLFPQPLWKLQAVCFGAGTFVAVGQSLILQSENVESAVITARLAHDRPSPTSPVIQIEGKTGQRYSIDVSTNLLEWLRYTNIESSQPLVTIPIGGSPPGGAGFYRVRPQ